MEKSRGLVQARAEPPLTPVDDDDVVEDLEKKRQRGGGGSTDGGEGTASGSAGQSDDGGKDDADPFVVDWKEDDPENPLNWSRGRKVVSVAIIAFITLITPLASSMFAPGIPEVLETFGETSETLAGFVVSVFLIGYVAGPLLWAPLAEYYGKLWIYHSSILLFVVFTVACAVAPSFNSLIGFRFLAGFAGASPLILGGSSIADCFVPERRGGVMALWAMGPLLGPVIGGFVAQSYLGWRWIFWLIAIVAGFCLILQFVFLRETYAPILLERRAAKLRRQHNDDRYVSRLTTGNATQLFWNAIQRPMKLLIFSPIVLSLSVFMALVYGILYLLFTTFAIVFEAQYHFSGGVVGLSYIGIGVGMFIGLFIFGATSDRAIKRKKARGEEIKPEVRLVLLFPGALCIPIGLFWYGWSAQAKVHWIVPIIGTSFVGIGLIGAFMPIQTYLIDSYTRYSASVTASVTILRSLVGAILPLAGQPLYNSLGLGWGNSLLAFIAIALCPIALVFLRYGEYLRTNEKFKVKL